MTDTDNPFGTFQQKEPMFTERTEGEDGRPTPDGTAAASPKRKSRRLKAAAAPSSPASSVKAAPRRKYTRKAPGKQIVRTDVSVASYKQVMPKLDLTALAGLTESEIGVIARLLEMPGIELIKIGKALVKLGSA